MNLSECGGRLMRSFESFVPYVYDDKVYPTREWHAGDPIVGTLTIGYGETDRSIIAAYTGRHCTEAEARAWFDRHIAERYEPPLTARGYPLTQQQWDIAVSFTYGVGTKWLTSGYATPPNTFTTIRRAFDEHRWGDVPAALRLYVNPGTSVEAGLRARREREIKVWVAGDYGFPCDQQPPPPQRVWEDDEPIDL